MGADQTRELPLGEAGALPHRVEALRDLGVELRLRQGLLTVRPAAEEPSVDDLQCVRGRA